MCRRLPPDALTILIDNREKLPLRFKSLKTEFACLVTGDYTVKGMEGFVGVERKSLADLARSLYKRPKGLAAQINRLLALPHGLLVIEASALDLDRGKWPYRNHITPEFLKHTITQWLTKGLQIVYAGTHERAGEIVEDYLKTMAEEYHRIHAPFFQQLSGCDGRLASPLSESPNQVGANKHSPSLIPSTTKRAA
jgi:ERCC4-type nuclease